MGGHIACGDMAPGFHICLFVGTALVAAFYIIHFTAAAIEKSV